MASQESNELVVYAEETSTTVTHQKLGRALAHVSAQTQDLANHQVRMHVNQQLNFQQQQLYTEARIQEARAEAESRTKALAQMIRSTQIDPVALELHVSSQLQSAISAANNVAHSEARAAVEAHAVQHAHMSDIQMEERFKQLQDKLHANFEQRISEVLSAHMEQVNAEIQLAIATQGKEMFKIMQQQMAAFQQEMSTHLNQAKRSAERKAKSIVRIHHEEENAAHAAIKTSLLQAMAEFKATTIADTIRHTEERIRLASKFELAPTIANSQTHGCSQTILESFQRVQTAEPSVELEAGRLTGVGVAASALVIPSEQSIELAESCNQEQESGDISARILQELGRLLNAAKTDPKSDTTKKEGLQAVCMAEQAKVAARAVARSRALTGVAKIPRRTQLEASQRNQKPPNAIKS